MNIGDIARRINELSEGYKIKGLQNFRQRLYGSTRSYKAIFSESGIKDDYAFHHGGREELQFNIGNEKEFFRYGVAFSLESSQSLPNPVAKLKPRILRFNRFVKENRTFFSGYLMWYWQNGSRSKDLPVQEVGDNLITNDTFIFIGNKIDKFTEKFNDSTYRKILSSFDHLYLLYRYVQSGNEWIARICWNNQYWQKPSGRSGKSENKGSYEWQSGFGHEEWLFDTSKMINEYHYSFLQQVNAHREKYVGRIFDVHLYTIDERTKKKWWIGKINNAWVVDADESKKIYAEYKHKGYLKEMIQQLTEVGISSDKLEEFQPEAFFNVKFKLNDLDVLDEPQQIAEDDKIISGTYYTTFNIFTSKPRIVVPLSGEFEPTSGIVPSKKFNAYRSYRKCNVEVDLSHNKLVSNSYEQMIKLFGKDNVTTSVSTGRGTFVDMVVKYNESYYFYEFKMTSSFVGCIRDSLAQLMEYAYYPDKVNAKKLIIVSNQRITEEGKVYMERLRREFNLPIYYQQYNQATEQLEPKQF